jgi:hypothetical protein
VGSSARASGSSASSSSASSERSAAMTTIALVSAILAAVAVGDFCWAFVFARFVTSFRVRRTAFTLFMLTSVLWLIIMGVCTLSYMLALILLSIVPGYENTPLVFRILMFGVLGVAVFWPTLAGFTRGTRSRTSRDGES